MARLRTAERQLPPGTSSEDECGGAGELRLPLPHPLTRAPRALALSALCFSRAPALSLSACAYFFHALALSLSFFSRRFSCVFPLSRAEASSYGARHARFGAIWTPKRRFLDASAVRRTPHESKASRLLRRCACSALALKRCLSDALKTLGKTYFNGGTFRFSAGLRPLSNAFRA